MLRPGSHPKALSPKAHYNTPVEGLKLQNNKGLYKTPVEKKNRTGEHRPRHRAMTSHRAGCHPVSALGTCEKEPRLLGFKTAEQESQGLCAGAN